MLTALLVFAVGLLFLFAICMLILISNHVECWCENKIKQWFNVT